MNQPIDAMTTLTHELALTCLDPWGREVRVPATIGYRVSDPYAISLLFHSAAGDVEWVVSRTLLLQGLASAAGEADFKVRPITDDEGHGVMEMEFNSPDGHLVAHADSAEVQMFLARTFAIVPVGTESHYLDIDSLVAELLGSAAA